MFFKLKLNYFIHNNIQNKITKPKKNKITKPKKIK